MAEHADLFRAHAQQIRRNQGVTTDRGYVHAKINDFPILAFQMQVAKLCTITKDMMHSVGFDPDLDDLDTALCFSSIWFLHICDLYKLSVRYTNNPIPEMHVRPMLRALQGEYWLLSHGDRETVRGELDPVFMKSPEVEGEAGVVILESPESMDFLHAHGMTRDVLEQFVFRPLVTCIFSAM